MYSACLGWVGGWVERLEIPARGLRPWAACCNSTPTTTNHDTKNKTRNARQFIETDAADRDEDALVEVSEYVRCKS